MRIHGWRTVRNLSGVGILHELPPFCCHRSRRHSYHLTAGMSPQAATAALQAILQPICRRHCET